MLGLEEVGSDDRRGVASFEVAAVEVLGVRDEIRVLRVLSLTFSHELVDDSLDEGWGMVRLRREIKVEIHRVLIRGGRDPSLLDSDCQIEEYRFLCGVLGGPYQPAER